jgi:predicted ATPase
MKLDLVQIRNFRSIKALDLPLDPSCRILVGINESGKSNILAALSLLSSEVPATSQDIRFESADEDVAISEAYVRFVFVMDQFDLEIIYAEVQKLILVADVARPIASMNGKGMTLQELCFSRAKGIFTANLLKSNKYETFYAFPSQLTVLPRWHKPAPACPAEFIAKNRAGENIQIVAYRGIDTDEVIDVPPSYMEPLTSKDLIEIIGQKIRERIKVALPGCVYWNYSEKNNLPAQINLTNFAADPASCLPLKHMFELAGIVDIPSEIDRKKTQSVHALRNLLDRISMQTTAYIRQVWDEPEYKDVKIELAPNGDNIDASVMDKTTRYDFAKRSDGFKRFISFLLMISTKVKTNTLANTVLLIDEPEVGLHPSGARHLLNELVKISSTNQVVFSTHSIFMIDRDDIGRHLIVKKTNGITTASRAEGANIVDEEVIYNAIGYSVFETLKQRNVVFEGWRDKKLYQTAIKGLTKADENLKSRLNSIGACHARGVKDIRSVSAFIELANRECLVISDDDVPAKEKQAQYKKDKGYGLWKRYSETAAGINAVTGEDFLKPPAFHKPLAKIKKEYPQLPELSDGDLCGPGGKLKCIETWLKGNGVAADNVSNQIRDLKEDLFNRLKHTDIEDAYRGVLVFIADDNSWPNSD